LGIINIIDITDVVDITIYLVDITIDIMDIVIDIMDIVSIIDIVNRYGYCRLDIVNIVVETSKHIKGVIGVSVRE
jgi:hypothetical protein